MAYYRQNSIGGVIRSPKIRTTLLRRDAEKEDEKVSSIELIST